MDRGRHFYNRLFLDVRDLPCQGDCTWPRVVHGSRTIEANKGTVLDAGMRDIDSMF